MLQEVFANSDVVFVYSDAEALEDGVLVDISSAGITFQGQPVNRMTGTLWNDLQPFYPDGEEGMDLTGLADALRVKLQGAKGGDGLWEIPPDLWLVDNGDGLTIMYPSDY